MCDMRAREALLSALLENEYGHLNFLNSSSENWKTLESKFEGHKHAKKIRL